MPPQLIIVLYNQQFAFYETLKEQASINKHDDVVIKLMHCNTKLVMNTSHTHSLLLTTANILVVRNRPPFRTFVCMCMFRTLHCYIFINIQIQDRICLQVSNSNQTNAQILYRSRRTLVIYRTQGKTFSYNVSKVHKRLLDARETFYLMNVVIKRCILRLRENNPIIVLPDVIIVIARLHMLMFTCSNTQIKINVKLRTTTQANSQLLIKCQSQ